MAHAPQPARQPRPKGAQKGTTRRSHQTGILNLSRKAKTPWVARSPRDR